MKKKDNGFKAIICLAAATVAIGGASIALSMMDKTPDNIGNTGNAGVTNTQDAGRTALDLAGANSKIKEAYVNTDGTYTVVVAEAGYVGEMIVENVYSADGKTLVAFNVISHTETDGIGTNAMSDDYKNALAGVTLPITASGMDKTVIEILGLKAEEAESTQPAAGLKDGVYKAQTEADDKGNYSFITVTIAGGKITEVTWDDMYNGELKSELSLTGKYDMKPVWATQAASLGKYVVDNQGTAGLVNEQGKTDAVSGVSIYIGGFASLVDQAIAQANGADGVYEAKTEPDEKGDYSFVTVTIEGGKITNVVWDEMYSGELKSVLSTTGRYAMKPVFATQAESMCKYVVENQGTAGLNLNAQGKTDAVSGVSISVNGFTGLVEEVLMQASATGEIVAPAAPVLEAAKVDVVSGATFTSQGVIRAIDEGFVFLRDCVLNK